MVYGGVTDHFKITLCTRSYSERGLRTVISGFLFGYDTGIVSAAMLYVPNNKGMQPMTSVWQEVIVSLTPGIAAIGSLLSGPGSDRLGRKKMIIGASVIFTVGAIVCAIAWTKVVLVIGRILLGCAIGFASMIVPVYVGEASPTHIRGRLLTGFQLLITAGMVIANIIGGAFSYIDPDNIGWRLMFGFAAVPAVIQFICFFFLPESPRWLYEHGRKEEAEQVIHYISCDKHSYFTKNNCRCLVGFILEIVNGYNMNWLKYIMDMNKNRNMQVRQYKSKPGKSMFPILFRKQLTFACSTDTSCSKTINFLGTLIPIIFVERVGRRILFFISIIGVILSLCAMGAAFLLINKDSASSSKDNTGINMSIPNQEYCHKFRNCDFCVTDDKCGFCQLNVKSEKKGFCLAIGSDNTVSATGPCSHISTNYDWEDNYCNTKYTALPIVIMAIYLLLFSTGYAPLPWVMNAEFYPLWARSTCVSISTASNWVFNLIISLTFLSLSQAATKYGMFINTFKIKDYQIPYFLFQELSSFTQDRIQRNKKNRNSSTSSLAHYNIGVAKDVL
uniref:MFS domain-containing protein n=1 Tax=Heterorhabditis bacteriophora TaxID=37862 RepID=A0A1I7WWI3_HETBA